MAKPPKDPPDITSYDVGYGKPPEKTRFKKGQSGNPNGRPKGAKNRPPESTQRLRSILMQEAYREVDIQEAQGSVRMTMAQAAIRSMAVKAAKGSLGAQKLLLQTLDAVESEQQQEKLDTYDKAFAYKQKMTRTIQEYKARGENVPEILPHPDDIELDIETGEVIFHGPVNEADLQLWENLHFQLDTIQEELEGWQVMYREEDEDDGIRKQLANDIENNEYLLKVTALSIMRRWHLSAKEVVSGFILQKILDQHVKEETDPVSPESFPDTNIDWEKLSKRFPETKRNG